MSYQGWTNYETWAVALWLNNEQGSYEQAVQMARDAVDEADGGDRPARGILADAIKEWMEEEAPDLGATLWGDLLGAALGAVDWHDVADHYLADLPVQDSEEASA